MESIALTAGKKLGEYLLKYGYGKIKDWMVKKISINKNDELKELLNDVLVEKDILLHLQKILESKDNFKNESIFKNYKDEEIKSIINEMFVEEKIDEKIKERIKMEMKNFHINDDNILNVLIKEKENKEKISFKEALNKFYNKDENGFINIDIKDSLIKLNKIKIAYEPNEKYDCLWDFDKEKKEDLDNLEKYINIPTMYLYFKNSLSSEKIHLINNFDKKYTKYFNSHIIDIDNKQNFLNLFEKSIINILINNNKNEIEKKSNEITDNILSRINFDSGNEINKITVLNNSLIQSIFKKFVFEDKLSNSAKGKCQKILSKYQEYIESRKKSYYSSFITKCGNEIIEILRDKINKRNPKPISLNKKEEVGEFMEDTHKKSILFINEMNNGKINDLNNSQNIDIKTAYGDNLSKKLERTFEDYFLHKTSVFINLLVIKIIKEIIRDYYETFIIQSFYDIHKDDYILED